MSSPDSPEHVAGRIPSLIVVSGSDGSRAWDRAPLGMMALLPVEWSRDLVAAGEALDSPEWLEPFGCRPLSLASLAWEGIGSSASSALADQIRTYRRLVQKQPDQDPEAPAEPTLAASLALLQLERRLRCRIDPRSWPAGSWRNPIDPRPWLKASAPPSPAEADQLVAMVHLLPGEEQPRFARRLAQQLGLLLRGGVGEDGSGQDGSEPPAEWVWSVCEALIGGLNTRQPELVDIGDRLRQEHLAAACRLEDPVQRTLRLIQGIDEASCRRDPQLVATLAAAIGVVVEQIEHASSRGDSRRRRLLQRQLSDALRSVGSNLLLLRELVLQLSPACCSQLPQRQPPSSCLLLLKGLLVLDRDRVVVLPEEQQGALVQLFERLLPRVWWQSDLLRVLLRDLRRFRLDPGWLGTQGGAVLEGMVRLHRYLVPPPEPGTPAGEGAEPVSPNPELALIRWQLLLLLRLAGGVRDRTNLLRRVRELEPGGTHLCWQGRNEGAILEAACAGLGVHTSSLLRLWSAARGVPELLPLLPRVDGVGEAFDRVLEHWRTYRQQLSSPSATAPITIVITTFRPDLKRLGQTLESLRLQTVQAEEILVVDDGSPDEEARDLQQLIALHRHGKGLPVRMIRQEQNRGQYACRNLAIAASRQRVVAIQDDDDLSHPLRLERQWQALQGGVLACYAQHVRLDEATGQPQPDGDGARAVGDGITTLMVRRATAAEMGGFYPVRSRGDVEFRNRLVRRYGQEAVGWLEQPLYLMRGAPTTISSGFEYGCSLRLPTWRRLIQEGYLT
ncbi:glycosyltransferase family 2 protein [Cyanobium sp. NIES-981]|uniref:glycosyltransferase family 2 protein n=1 Tax=Cyanobium sp. NIES-981 TaxID=1851505 RepID=UPI0012FC54EB|nr:glycosyltransferase family 2 protein [Cyanobium sp. NIES-981]